MIKGYCMERLRTVEEGETLLVRGPARITLRTGRIRIDGADRSRYIVKEGISCTLEGVQESEVEIVLGSGAKMEKITKAENFNSPVPRIWSKYSHEILQEKGTVMIIGAPDTGKTTFAAFLANQALEKGIPVALIDSDIGQSDIGPPSTIGLAFPQHTIGRISDIAGDDFYFVGTTSVQDVCDMVLGLQELVKKAQNRAELVIIDTCGYVLGDTGRKLKILKMQAVNPDFVVALQRKGELYPVLRSWSGKVMEVEVPKKVKKVPRHIRKEIRESRWRKAFEGAIERQVDLEEKRLLNTYLLSGKRIDVGIFEKLLQCKILHAEEIPEGFFLIRKDVIHEYQPQHVSFSGNTVRTLDAGWEEDLVVGLLKSGAFVGLGILKQINYKNLMAIISCREHKFDSIKFGRIKVNESGCERGFIGWC
jgi:polynucleotide 5'-hydroxyl-kinase GRC3/NOL9